MFAIDEFALPAIAVIVVYTAAAQAAAGDTGVPLHNLIGKDEATIERTIGPPDESGRNGVQAFLKYRSFDSWRTSSKPYPFGYSQGFSGPTSFARHREF
ncbi:MAG: hypothetical protein JO139_14095 [Alphaproteobacteria bacterium]|nr:hypothetical protein [Alphaproteobacteria bacterium]